MTTNSISCTIPSEEPALILPSYWTWEMPCVVSSFFVQIRLELTVHLPFQRGPFNIPFRIGLDCGLQVLPGSDGFIKSIPCLVGRPDITHNVLHRQAEDLADRSCEIFYLPVCAYIITLQLLNGIPQVTYASPKEPLPDCLKGSGFFCSVSRLFSAPAEGLRHRVVVNAGWG